MAYCPLTLIVLFGTLMFHKLPFVHLLQYHAFFCQFYIVALLSPALLFYPSHGLWLWYTDDWWLFHHGHFHHHFISKAFTSNQSTWLELHRIQTCQVVIIWFRSVFMGIQQLLMMISMQDASNLVHKFLEWNAMPMGVLFFPNIRQNLERWHTLEFIILTCDMRLPLELVFFRHFRSLGNTHS